MMSQVSQGSVLTRNEIFQVVIRVSLLSVATYFSLKWLMNQMDPTNKNKKQAKTTAHDTLTR